MKTAPLSPSTRRRALRVSLRGRLIINAGLSRRTRFLASLLKVRPPDFLEWVVSDYLLGLEDPGNGLLTAWAEREIEYEDRAEAEEAARRVRDWVERRRAAIEAGTTGKGGSSK